MAWACGHLGYGAQLLIGTLLQQAVKLLQKGGNFTERDVLHSAEEQPQYLLGKLSSLGG